MDWIKNYIAGFVAEDKIDEFVEGFKKEFPKHAALKSDFNRVNGELKATQEKLDEQSKTIEELSGKTGLADELKGKLEELTSEYDQFKSGTEKRENDILKRAQMQIQMSEDFAADAVPLILDKLELDTFRLEDGKISDWDKHKSALAEKYPTLAKVKTVQSDEPDKKPLDKSVDTSNLSDEEYYKSQNLKPLW